MPAPLPRLPHPATAFILGAGLGTRLRPLTDTWPKPLLPVRGTPMVAHTMARLAAAGASRFLINTHHAPHRWVESFPGNLWNGHALAYSHEPVLLDTGGGLRGIENLLVPADDALWLHNGDILTTFDLVPLARAHASRPEALATLALRSEGPGRNVSFDPETNEVLDLRGLNRAPVPQLTQYSGVALLSRALWTELHREKEEVFSLVPVLARLARERPGSIRGLLCDDGDWQDLGTPEEYHAAGGDW